VLDQRRLGDETDPKPGALQRMLPSHGAEVRLAQVRDLVVAHPDLVGHDGLCPRLEQERAYPAPAQARVEVGAGACPQPRGPGRLPFGRRPHFRQHSVVESPVQREQVTGPVAEVVEEAALGDASLLHHAVHAHPGERGRLGELEAGLDQRLPRAPRVLLPGYHNTESIFSDSEKGDRTRSSATRTYQC
jgi:hypothetical protein